VRRTSHFYHFAGLDDIAKHFVLEIPWRCHFAGEQVDVRFDREAEQKATTSQETLLSGMDCDSFAQAIDANQSIALTGSRKEATWLLH
jgi:hypothetical protein